MNDKLNELENKKNISENDREILQAKIDDLIDNNNNKLEDFIEHYHGIIKEKKDEIYNELNKFKNNMEDEMHNFDKKFTIKENKLHAK